MQPLLNNESESYIFIFFSGFVSTFHQNFSPVLFSGVVLLLLTCTLCPLPMELSWMQFQEPIEESVQPARHKGFESEKVKQKIFKSPQKK